MYYEFKVKDTVYNLKLTTRDILRLEEKLGRNPMALFGLDPKHPQVPKMSEVLDVIACAFPAYNHGISENDIYDIIDAWIDDGHTQDELYTVIDNIYKTSGVYKGKNL